MENKKNNSGLIVLVVVLLSSVLCLGGYIVYDKVLSNKEKGTDREKIQEDTKSKYGDDDFNKIVTDHLGLTALLNKNTLNEMTNQEKLRYLISLYDNDDKYTTFSASALDELHRNSVIANLDIIYEDLLDYYGPYSWGKAVAYRYSSSDNTFTYTGALGHGGGGRGNIANSKMLSLTKNEDTYTVKYSYLFYNGMGDGPTDVKLFLNINDALNDENQLAYLPLKEDNNTHMNEYIEQHYDEIKDRLQVYTYVFTEINGHLVITDFSVE